MGRRRKWRARAAWSEWTLHCPAKEDEGWVSHAEIGIWNRWPGNVASTSQIEITQRALKQGGQGTSVWDFGAGPKNRRGSLAGGRPAICSLIVRDGLYFTLYGVRQWRGKRPELTNHFKCPNELPIARRGGGGGDVQGE